MRSIPLLFATIAFSLVFEACATDDPRGYHPVEIGNTADEKQLVRDGRDTQTYVNTKMPAPPSAESSYTGEMPEAQIHGNKKEDIKVNDKLDYKKIERH